MALNLTGRGAIVALLMVVAAAGQVADANFAASPGFSGRAGVTCLACHTEAPVFNSPASAVLDGLPKAWDPGQTYELSIAVTGGPTAMPAPQPQGGFDLDVGDGTLQIPSGSEDKLRLVGDHEATYRPAGTLQRAWTVQWTAPDLSSRPIPVPMWLAVVSANGNHVIASNTSDGGERFDSVAAIQVSVPPSSGAYAAWREMPLLAPVANATLASPGTWTLDGQHQDGNASRLLWSIDGGPWQSRETANSWKLTLTGLDGDHKVALRSEGLDRHSPDVTLSLSTPGLLDNVPGGKSVPVPPALPLLAIALALVVRRLLP